MYGLRRTQRATASSVNKNRRDMSKLYTDALGRSFKQGETRFSNPSLSDNPACIPQKLLQDAVEHHDSPQLSSPMEVSSSTKPFQPYSFLNLPSEIRLIIYELIVGSNQRIYVQSFLHDSLAHITVRSKNHRGLLRLRKQKAQSQDRVLFFHMPCGGYEASFANFKNTKVSHDLQTGEQQIITNELTFNDKPSVCQDEAACGGRMLDLALLQTCGQIYDEMRSVLYQNNTFVFWGLDTFAAYFGIANVANTYVSHSTEPNRLRAIRAMTKVELHGTVDDTKRESFLSISRLIRAGLGCLTSLSSLELHLKFLHYFNRKRGLRKWMIDDSMFSKPSSLRKIVIDVHNLDLGHHRHRPRFITDELVLANDNERLVIAEELMHRMVKQEGFRDTIERFLGRDRLAACGATLEEV